MRHATHFTAEQRRKGAATRIGVTLAEYEARRAAGEKWCWRCRSWQWREEFPPNASTADGRQAMCGDCKRTYNHARYRKLAVTR
jgi:hypothetical protein